MTNHVMLRFLVRAHVYVTKVPRTETIESSQKIDTFWTSTVTLYILLIYCKEAARPAKMSQRQGTSTQIHDDAHTINCQDLTYSFTEGSESALTGATLQLPKGARCLLVGANGGKHFP